MSLASKGSSLRAFLQRGRILKKSLLDGLSRHVPFRTLEQLALTGEDWRTLVKRSAEQLEIEEEKLIEKLGKTMRVGVLKRIRTIDPIVMDRIPDIETLRNNAVVPLVGEGIIIGYACVDPSRVLGLVEEVQRHQLYLASWGKIAKALASSEEVFAEERERLATYQQDLLRKKARVALEKIVEEVRRFEANGCRIRIGADVVAYEFKLNDGRRGSGEIHHMLRAETVAILNNAAVSNCSLFDDVKSDVVSVQVESPYECFYLSWQTEDTVLAVGKVAEEVTRHKPSLCVPTPALVAVWQGNCSVLVVEDNDSFARVLEYFLCKHSFDVTFATNGQDALEQLHGGLNPDVIVCDVHMPGMNGHAFLKEIRRQEEFKRRPVIMLTSDVDIETELTFVAYGVEAFLSKSADPRLLIGHIKRVMSRERPNSCKQRAA